VAGQAHVTPPSPAPQNIAREIERTAMTTTEVGAAIGVHERQVRRWSLEGHEPSWRFVVALGELFGRDPAWFYVAHPQPDREAA
jgi:hypothetical protein